MRSFIAVTALAALLVAADNSTFTIDPTEVELTTRASWCNGQTSTCDTLCESSAEENSCDPNTLDYSCTCSNGSAPGLQYYTQTIDTYVCQQAFTDCNEANVGNAAGQKNCTTSIQDNCGTLDPADFSAASPSTSSAASTASATSAASSSAASAAASSTASAAAAAATNFQHIGTGALAAGMGVLAYLL
ncbi:hypothetical protein VSDG_06526 [Cytospora chrysosperma]|uniref:DUF7707 domain-containing protein n=1 Tax=Cytospora chrysosperma TaxID=252740 RepID=A0A423VLG5_CYTCH|nr:hypothetical protein VSDG_06526 [Valsa sordida]